MKSHARMIPDAAPDPFFDPLPCEMGLNSHKSVLFKVIEKIINFPVIYGYPYVFLLRLVKNVGQMGQKWVKIHLSSVSYLCDSSLMRSSPCQRRPLFYGLKSDPIHKKKLKA